MNYPGVVLKKGITNFGDECLYIKQCLYSLGYLSSKPKKKNFGSDTETAVKKFQKSHTDNNGRPLEVDGKIGELTWGAIIREYEKLNNTTQTPSNNSILKPSDFPYVTMSNLTAIEHDLKSLDAKRVEFVKFILKYARDIDYDKDIKPSALYIFGANLVDSKLNVQLASESGFLEAKYNRNPQYFSGGRYEWMKSWIKKDPKLVASDCSGMVVGFLRLYGYTKSTFDTTANGLCGSGYSYATTRSKLVPGDFVGFSGHIGVYVGGGFVVEFAGGAYGCQLTRLTNRKLRNLMNNTIASGKPWTKFRTPKWFK